MPLTYAYRAHPISGKVQHVVCDLTDLPRLIREGWHDSPEKVPDAVPDNYRPGAPGREPPPSPEAHGDPVRRGPGRPRKDAA